MKTVNERNIMSPEKDIQGKPAYIKFALMAETKYLFAAALFLLSSFAAVPAFGKTDLSLQNNEIITKSILTSECSILTNITCADSDLVTPSEKSKSNTAKKKKTTVAKKQAEESLFDEDNDNDNDMYSTYDKWRIDKFDNWGKHKKKNEVVTEQENEEPVKE